MKTDVCPKCSAPTVITGQLTAWRGDPADTFIPPNVRFVRWRKGVPLDNTPSRVCTSCGLVWTTLDPASLRAFITDYGDALSKEDLELAPPAPLVPPPSAEAVQSVDEIDDLVRSGHQPRAVQRYHELTGGTWDQAIDALRVWRHSTRDQRLALFGWRPKPTPEPGHPAPTPHPLHDRRLDG